MSAFFIPIFLVLLAANVVNEQPRDVSGRVTISLAVAHVDVLEGSWRHSAAHQHSMHAVIGPYHCTLVV